MGARARRKEAAGKRSEIDALFERASAIAARDPAGARDLVRKARQLASRKRISLRIHNRIHCRKCCAYFTAKTLRVRNRPQVVIYTCLSCGHMTRLRKR